MPGYTEMNNESQPARSRISPVKSIKDAWRRHCKKTVQSSEAKEKHQGYIPGLMIKGAVMVEGLCPQSAPIKTVHNTKLVATKHHKCPEDKGNKPRIPRIEIKRIRVRNRPLPCQMPCSDRGIYEVKTNEAINQITHTTSMAYTKEPLPWVGGWAGGIEKIIEAGINALSARVSILPPLSGCSCSRVSHCSTQEQERPESGAPPTISK